MASQSGKRLSPWLLCTLLLTSCYRMPTEDDFSVVPTTNNPAITQEKNTNFIPGMGY